MSEWPQVPLGDFADVQNGYAFKSKEFSDQGTPVIKIKNVASGEITWDGISFFSGSAKDLDKFLLHRGDILIAMTGSHLTQVSSAVGKVAKYNLDIEALLNQRVGKVYPKDFKKLDNEFLYYFLVQPVTQYKLGVGASGSANQANISPSQIKGLLIDLPPITEQREIATTLSCLDRKIENLRKQDETLEAIAQTFFKHWFVDFEFPNADGKPYKSSGGEMVRSELGEIPAGWRVGKLSSIVNTINGYSYKSTDLGESNTALVNLKNFDRNGGFRLDGFKEIATENYQDKHIVVLNDLLVAHTDLTQNAEVLGNPVLSQPLPKYFCYVLSMDVVKVVSKDKRINNFYLYYLFSTNSFKKHCVGYANGTTVLHLSKKAIPEYEFPLPKDYSIIEAFQDLASATRKRISNNLTQIQILTKTRDVLLPKLMSGKLRIKV